MTDLISRQAAIDAIHEDSDWLASQGSDWQVERMERDKSILRSLPSAQPEIIRCKDCMYYEIYELKADHTDDKRYKPSVCVKGKFAVKRRADWYCADAERRTDG